MNLLINPETFKKGAIKKFFFNLLLFFFSVIFNIQSVSAISIEKKLEPLTVYYLERVPYFYTFEDGVRGLVVDRVKLVFEKAEIPIKWKLLPAKRHMKFLKANKEKFCTIGWYKNDKRMKFAKYSEYIYQNKTRIALAKADNDKIRSGLTLDDVFLNTQLSLIVKDGYSYGSFIDKKIAKYNPVRQKVTVENISMIRMIHKGRADYFFTSEEEADILIPETGFKRDDFQYVKFSNMPAGLKRYILYSKKVENDIILKVDEAIRKYIHNQ